MQVIILAAGEGIRMGEIAKKNHKSLLKISDNESLLSHLIHQLNEYPISKLVVVTGHFSEKIVSVVKSFQIPYHIIYNDLYKEDTNIYSMKLALQLIDNNENTIVFESDIFLDDLAMKRVMEQSNNNKSIWFTRGKLKENVNGGILSSDNDYNINEIKIIPSYKSSYSKFYKLTGIMTVSKEHIDLFKDLIKKYSNKKIDQYYLIPWIENLNDLPCINVDLDEFFIDTFNTYQSYKEFVNKLELKRKDEIKKIEIVSIEYLLPIEDYINKRVKLLAKEISDSKYWIKPIIVEKKYNLILDGHHRFEVAKRINLKLIPVIYVEYEDVEVWSLRDDEYVDIPEVIKRAKMNNIYPNKTVKHNFPFLIPSCKIEINKLKR